MAATGDYFSSYTALFQYFVSEKIGLFVFLCIDTELNIYNRLKVIHANLLQKKQLYRIFP